MRVGMIVGCSIVIVCLCSYGCGSKPSSENHVSNQDGAVKKTLDAAASDLPCPSEDFTKFLPKFLESTPVQTQFTSSAVSEVVFDSAVDKESSSDYKTEFRQMTGRPVARSKEGWLHAGLRIHRVISGTDQATATFRDADNKSRTDLTFRRTNQCWFLATIVRASVAADQIQAAENASQGKCPWGSFEAFIEAFAADPKIQWMFAEVPLRWTSIANELPEPYRMTRFLGIEDIRFPVLISSLARQKQGIELKIADADGVSPRVMMSLPDTDYVVWYYFRQENKCWLMTEVEDFSL